MKNDDMPLGLALNLVDPKTRPSALNIFDGPIARHKAFARACRVAAANGKQVRKALHDAGFRDIGSLLKVCGQVKSEPEEPCAFCRDDRPESLVSDEVEAVITQITPFPAICLTTGEKAPKADPPYYAILARLYDGDYYAEQIIPIQYCPHCGRRLISTRTYESILKQRLDKGKE